MMKILVFECWSNSPQFETGLEIAENHAIKGDDVTYVNIGGFLPFIEWYLKPNPTNKSKKIYKDIFLAKMKRTKKVVNSKINFNYDTLLSNQEINDAFHHINFNSLDELKDFEWRGIDIGMAVASSLISVTNDVTPDVKIEHAKGVENILHAAKISALSFEKWLDKVNPDLVYFRNGRVALYRPVMRICQQRNQNFLIHDRGCNKNHYTISPDLRHNFDMVNQEIIDAWDNESNDEKKHKIAHEYFQHRRAGKEQSWLTFLENQEKDILPENWNPNKFNITFFNSSISEYAAIGKINESESAFKTQFEAIDFIAEIAKNNNEIEFYLRLHPNLVNQSDKELKTWMALDKNPNINLIPADSEIDTYAMMLNSNINISFLSTTGIESAYYNKPSIQLAKSWYYKLGSTYFPKTKEEFKNLLTDFDIKPKDNLGALKFGYYMNTFGNKYIHFKPNSLHHGTFKGHDLHELPTKYKLANKLKKLFK